MTIWDIRIVILYFLIRIDLRIFTHEQATAPRCNNLNKFLYNIHMSYTVITYLLLVCRAADTLCL